jgi:SAM-dependent methyltransferase
LFELTENMLSGLPKNGPTDPIEYYRRPLIGRLFRKRINLGLGLLPEKRFKRALEVGYGAGAVQLALAGGVEELFGIDLDADAKLVSSMLEARGIQASLSRGSVYELPYEADCFDLVVCFSVFEHLAEYHRGLGEVYRTLRPGGLFLLGMPSVNKLMEAGFLAIGFKGINDHHVTTPAEVATAAPEVGFRTMAERHLDFPGRAPLGARLYYDWLFEKPLERSRPVP